jgi:hypothetical protein
MAKPVQKVEIGFDLTENNVGPYFRLDDPVAGVLDGTEYVLGGTIFFDVTSAVKEFTIRRGKSRQLDRYSTGQARVNFNNNNRDFDPEYESSPYYGQIIPRRELRITSGTAVQYFGSVDDWNLLYEPNGDNIAEALCSDGFRTFANQLLQNYTNTEQASGARVNAVLNRTEINWPAEKRSIDTGRQTLGADEVSADTNALAYLQKVEASEPGSLYIGKSGNVVFRDRAVAPTSDVAVLADDGSGIPYQGMRVVYGSELLYNEIEISSVITGGTATASDSLSQGNYGILTLSQTDLLMSTTEAAQELADYYATLYSSPEFRFESVEILMNDLTDEQQNQIFDLELGSVVKVVFTPGNPKQSPAIEKYAEIIRIDMAVDSIFHKVSLGFATLDSAYLVLDDAVFGRLNTGTLGF